MSDAVIREYRGGDIPEMSALWQAVFGDSEGLVNSFLQLLPGMGTAAVAEVNGKIAGAAYAVTGARSLRSAATLGTVIHLIGGILGMLTMLALGYLGSTELLTPTNVLLYQLIWMIPGFLVTEWTRAV